MTSRSTRTITLVGVTAAVSLAVGLGLGRLVVSPAEHAANAAPPEAGPITVPVERRVLSNDVVLRGDVLYEDPTAVRIETGDLGGPAVVTGQVPAVGTEITPGAVVLEVAGRPVIALTGELPVYRTLRAGVSGPDVEQLKAALGELGIAAGDGAAYDWATAAAVAELYARVGYPKPATDAETQGALDAAAEGVAAAEAQLAGAKRALTAAAAGRPRSEILQFQATLDTARVRLQQANEACGNPTETAPCDRAAVVDATGAVAVAEAALAEAKAAPNTSSERAEVTAAEQALSEARADLGDARAAAITPLPASEVVYLPNLPRRVDGVGVERGSLISGEIMRVSGARLQIAGAVSEGDASLLVQGAPAVIELPDGTQATGTVEEIGGENGPGQPPVAEGRTRVIVVPGELTEEQRVAVQGRNVRITIPVTSTTEEVLSVPLAAVDTGPGGEARIDVVGDEEGTTTLLTVRLGLAADGYVEVTPVDGELAEGDRVVVGIAGTAGEPTGETTGEPDDDATAGG